MKSRKILKSLLTTIAFVTLFSNAAVTVNAANSNSAKTPTTTHVKNTPKLIIKSTPELSKWGYIINVNSSAQPIYVGTSNYEKLLNNPLFKGTETVSPKKIKHVRFKVVKIMFFKNVSGSPEYFVTSKDHKYNCWTPNAGLQYYAISSKPIQKVLKLIKRIEKREFNKNHSEYNSNGKIINRKWIAQNERDFAAAVKVAKKLKGNQRKFVLESLKQMKQDGIIHNVMLEEQNNILLWSVK